MEIDDAHDIEVDDADEVEGEGEEVITTGIRPLFSALSASSAGVSKLC